MEAAGGVANVYRRWRERLDVWLALFIIILHYGQSTSGVENVVVALEHSK
jgi:hypothetical protein